MAGKFEVYRDSSSKYRWQLEAGNGEVVATGEAYESKDGAVRGTEAVQRAAAGATVTDLT
ncbi:YegP family protein [Terrabacter sp. 2YAF2]|uniref:YegP family protein n=1 Tax=Terrabacter sp. 2YAF2 TaxID=3233026 RepID=UPI003F9D0939